MIAVYCFLFVRVSKESSPCPFFPFNEALSNGTKANPYVILIKQLLVCHQNRKNHTGHFHNSACVSSAVTGCWGRGGGRKETVLLVFKLDPMHCCVFIEEKKKIEEIVFDSLSRVDETNKKKSSQWVDMLAWNFFISCFTESDWQCKLCIYA